MNKCQTKSTSRHSISKPQQIKDLKKPDRSKKKKLLIEKKIIITSDFSESHKQEDDGVKYLQCWEGKKTSLISYMKNYLSKVEKK